MLELDGIEGGKNIAQLIMRGRPITKWPKPAQQVELLFAKQRNIDEGLGSGQHCKQTHQQHLVERIDHLAGLPRVRQILEVTQKNNRLAKRREPRRRFHRILRIANQRITTDSALQAFITNFFTRLPW
jgi:hypothetical protein